MKTDMTLDKTSTKRESNRMDEQHYRFQLSAEFNQFYLQDEASEGEATWSIEEELNNVALDAGLIAVGTECDRVVPVEIHISASEPLLDVEAWDHIVECTIDVPSGHLVVCGCVDDFATAARSWIPENTEHESAMAISSSLTGMEGCSVLDRPLLIAALRIIGSTTIFIRFVSLEFKTINSKPECQPTRE